MPNNKRKIFDPFMGLFLALNLFFWLIPILREAAHYALMPSGGLAWGYTNQACVVLRDTLRERRLIIRIFK
jgi:hypothetical protein